MCLFSKETSPTSNSTRHPDVDTGLRLTKGEKKIWPWGARLLDLLEITLEGETVFGMAWFVGEWLGSLMHLWNHDCHTIQTT